jgi:SRSO17 transposase
LSDVLPDRRGILAIDDTGLPKQGRHSVGVKRQYSGTLGKTGNCQVAVTSLLIGRPLVWPVRCELYLPRDWTDDAERCASVGLPSRVGFREKWRIALAQVRAVLNQGIHVTAVVADADYGSTTGFRHGLERLGLRYASESLHAPRLDRGRSAGADGRRPGQAGARSPVATRVLGARHQRAARHRRSGGSVERRRALRVVGAACGGCGA